MNELPRVVVLDLDGTLVDTNYHHAVAWYRAFRQSGFVVPIWRIHRHVGMGGDQFVPAIVGEDADREKGDEVRSAHSTLYMAMIEEVSSLPGARELIEALKQRDHAVVLASSAKENELEHYLGLLDIRELLDGWTSSADVEATKPHPDVVESALDEAGGGREAILIGDSVYDCEAAKRAGIPSIGVLTGGFSESELREAGAAVVFVSLVERRRALVDDP